MPKVAVCTWRLCSRGFQAFTNGGRRGGRSGVGPCRQVERITIVSPACSNIRTARHRYPARNANKPESCGLVVKIGVALPGLGLATTDEPVTVTSALRLNRRTRDSKGRAILRAWKPSGLGPRPFRELFVRGSGGGSNLLPACFWAPLTRTRRGPVTLERTRSRL